jgi:hypothetical protein
MHQHYITAVRLQMGHVLGPGRGFDMIVVMKRDDGKESNGRFQRRCSSGR